MYTQRIQYFSLLYLIIILACFIHILFHSNDDCSGGICDPETCTCSCLPCHGQVSAGCEFNCDCKDACVVSDESPGGTCDSSMCTACTAANADEKCKKDQDCIIPPGSYNGKCIEAGICTQTKDDLCDVAWSAVSAGDGDSSAKCCPDTSACIKSTIGVKATSTCSTNCGSCLGSTRENKMGIPTTFCRFGSRIGAFQLPGKSSFCSISLLSPLQ